eukprot:TRINITY_DN5737_c0_g3_i1.p1 TRINITY_DN5737_c0_g3~~TRINITY_DN5737_c0_g3_i1.p1  ORF type:complete len:1273 (+),score=395.83 TRINITY_DN5737_c0_g3_i1:52-3870(+)
MEVLKNLQEDELDALRGEFDSFGGDAKGLTIEQFSEVLLKAAHGKQISNHALLSKDRLRDLFNEIDFNGDTRVSWEEFTMFVIDSMLKGKYEGDEVIKSYVPVKASRVPIGETPRGDGFAMAAEINHLKYFPDLNEICKVSTFGRETRLKLIDPTTGRSTAWTPKLQHSIVGVESIAEADVLATSSGGMHVHFWDTSPHPPGIPGRARFQNTEEEHTLLLKKTVAVPETQLALRWCRRYNTLFSASRTGCLNYWSMDKMEIVKTQPKVHEEAILDLLVVDHEVVTASLDSTVRVLNLERNAEQTGILRGHTQGVCNLAYSKPHQFLVSAGFEYEPLVWVLHIKDFRPWRLVDKQQPHHGTIQGVFTVPDTPQVITSDSLGMVKVWDLRTFQAVQTILPWQHSHLTQHFTRGNLSSAVCHVESTDSIVMSGPGSTFVYRYQQTDNHTCADNLSILTALYNENTRALVSVHKRGVKIWNEVTGLIETVFNELVFGNDEITAFCLCNRGRKFFVGTMSGMVYSYALSNAACGGEKKVFKASVTDMLYGDARAKVLIAISQTDSPHMIVVSDNAEWSTIPCTALNIVFQSSAPACLKLSAHTGILCVGTVTGRLVLADPQSFVLIHVIEPQGGSPTAPAAILPQSRQEPDTGLLGEATAVCCLGRYPAVACADITGHVYVWTIRPYPAPQRLIGRCDLNGFTPPDKVGKGGELRIGTTMSFHSGRKDLYVGDDQGRVFCLPLAGVFDAAGVAASRTGGSKKVPQVQVTEQIPCRHHWKAHGDELSNVSVVIDMNRVTIMTSGYDLKVHIWNTNADLIASLCQGRRIIRTEEKEKKDKDAQRQGKGAADPAKDEVGRDEGQAKHAAVASPSRAKAKNVNGRTMPPWDFKTAATMLDDFNISTDVQKLGRLGLKARKASQPGSPVTLTKKGHRASALFAKVASSRAVQHFFGQNLLSPTLSPESDASIPQPRSGAFMTAVDLGGHDVMSESMHSQEDEADAVFIPLEALRKKPAHKRVPLPRPMKQNMLQRMHKVERPAAKKPRRTARHSITAAAPLLPPVEYRSEATAAAPHASVVDTPRHPYADSLGFLPSLNAAAPPDPKPPPVRAPAMARPGPRPSVPERPAAVNIREPPAAECAAAPSPPKGAKAALRPKPGAGRSAQALKLPTPPVLFKNIEATKNSLRAGPESRLPTRTSCLPDFHVPPVQVKHPLQAQHPQERLETPHEQKCSKRCTSPRKVPVRLLMAQPSAKSPLQNILYWADPDQPLSTLTAPKGEA